MDAFEQIVAMLLQRDGYWVQTSFKVNLTKQDKVRMGLPSSPRWEIDVLAYRPSEDKVLAIECKSFLNSPGVSYPSFSGANAKGAGTYKLFTNAKIRKVVLNRLSAQLQDVGLTKEPMDVQLCLAAGHLRKGHEQKIRDHCDKNGWKLFADDWFGEHFADLPDSEYENDVATVAAKLASTFGSGRSVRAEA